MMWQDLIFLAGSVFSIVVLTPTLRDSTARVPLGTSLPSALIGMIYGATFLSMSMSFSAAGSLLAGVMWSFIAYLRSPSADFLTDRARRSAHALRDGWSAHKVAP